jgi:hypothetical protein
LVMRCLKKLRRPESRRLSMRATSITGSSRGVRSPKVPALPVALAPGRAPVGPEQAEVLFDRPGAPGFEVGLAEGSEAFLVPVAQILLGVKPQVLGTDQALIAAGAQAPTALPNSAPVVRFCAQCHVERAGQDPKHWTTTLDYVARAYLNGVVGIANPPFARGSIPRKRSREQFPEDVG